MSSYSSSVNYFSLEWSTFDSIISLISFFSSLSLLNYVSIFAKCSLTCTMFWQLSAYLVVTATDRFSYKVASLPWKLSVIFLSASCTSSTLTLSSIPFSDHSFSSVVHVSRECYTWQMISDFIVYWRLASSFITFLWAPSTIFPSISTSYCRSLAISLAWTLSSFCSSSAFCWLS